ASHCPVSLDRPHEQDREVQATTPLPRRGRAERPRATADDDGSLRGRKGTTHRRPCPDSARASLPARDQLRHPPGAASRARSDAYQAGPWITRAYRAVIYSFYVLLGKNLYQR